MSTVLDELIELRADQKRLEKMERLNLQILRMNAYEYCVVGMAGSGIAEFDRDWRKAIDKVKPEIPFDVSDSERRLLIHLHNTGILALTRAVELGYQVDIENLLQRGMIKEVFENGVTVLKLASKIR